MLRRLGVPLDIAMRILGHANIAMTGEVYATRYDKHATVYRAAVVLNAVIAWTRQLSDPP